VQTPVVRRLAQYPESGCSKAESPPGALNSVIIGGDGLVFNADKHNFACAKINSKQVLRVRVFVER
jgi:hypothetical protein